MCIITENVGLLEKSLFNYFLLLVATVSSLFFLCFEIIGSDEESMDINSKKHTHNGYINHKKYDSYDITTEDNEREQNNCRLNFYSCSYLSIIYTSMWCRPSREVLILQLSPKNFLETMPNEIIHEITTYLDPLSIVKLSHVSKRIREFLSNDFWIQYNLSHSYQTFNEKNSYLFILSYTRPAIPIKVMIANYHYEIGIKENKQHLIKKSSLLGLPKARNYFEKASSQTFSSSTKISNYSYICDDYGKFSREGICRRCVAPPAYCRCYY